MNKDLKKVLRDLNRKKAIRNQEGVEVNILNDGTMSIRGVDGYTPQKGIDYWTPDEVNEMVSTIFKAAKPNKGVDYYTDAEKRDFIKEILKIATPVKGIHYRDGIDGKDGRDGKDADEIDPRQVAIDAINYLETFEGDARLSAKALKDLEEAVEEILEERGEVEFSEKQINTIRDLLPKYPPQNAGGSGATFLKSLRDVDLSRLTKNADGKYVLGSGSGTGGGHTIQDEGTPLTQRTNLNFVGAGVAVTDDAGNDATVVTITATGGGAVDSVNGETGVVVLTTDDISDAAQTNKWATAAEKTKLGHISVTQAVDLDAIEAASHAAVTVVDSAEIDLTLTGQQISASIVAGSIDESKLDASVNASLDLADSASQPGHTHVISDITSLQTTLDGKQDEAVVVSGSLTAALDQYYVNVATATYTDPTPSEGKGFIVFVRNGTATVGGTGYSTAGTIIHRVYHSGAWANYVYQVSSTFALASHTHTASQITDFDTEVSNNTDVAANTAARHDAATVLDSTSIDMIISGQQISAQREALTGAITASKNSNTTALGSFTKSELSTAVSDGDVLFVGDVTSNATHTGEVTGATALTVDKTAITNKTQVSAAVGDQVLIADASDTDNLKRVTVQSIIDLVSGGSNTYFNDIYIDQAGGTSDTYGALSGTRNGSNTLFTVSQSAYATGTLQVWRNGQLLTQGSSEDWVETTPASGTFTFTVAPAATDEITVAYQKVVVNSSTVVTTSTVNELAQDAVGTILVDSSEIDFTYNDATPSITASIVAGSIDETKLDASVNASLDLADNSVQKVVSTDNAIARFDGMGGAVQNSGVTIGDSNNMAITIADTANVVGLTITQNDVTNNPSAASIVNIGSGYELSLKKDTDTAQGAYIELYHDSASPAANDFQGFDFYWNNSVGTKKVFADFNAAVLDPTSGSEDAFSYFNVMVGGTLRQLLTIGDTVNGIRVGGSHANGVLSSNGNNDLILQTGNATTGSITIADGANGNISLTPNGTGVVAVSTDLTVTDEAYGAGWNGSLEVPTKNAIYDKIETLGGGGFTQGKALAMTLSAPLV